MSYAINRWLDSTENLINEFKDIERETKKKTTTTTQRGMKDWKKWL